MSANGKQNDSHRSGMRPRRPAETVALANSSVRRPRKIVNTADFPDVHQPVSDAVKDLETDEAWDEQWEDVDAEGETNGSAETTEPVPEQTAQSSSAAALPPAVPKRYIDTQLLQLFAEDCDDLLKAFRHTGSLSYRSFMGIWKQYHFGALAGSLRQLLARHYTNLYLFNGLWSDFIHRAFASTRRVYATAYRVGALYLTYNLYKLKGPLTCCRVRIRLTQEMDDISELVYSLRNDQSCGSHVLLIVAELLHSGVFMMTPLRAPVVPTTATSSSAAALRASRLYGGGDTAKDAGSLVDFVRELVEKPEFSALERANAAYVEGRNAVLSLDPDYEQILSMEDNASATATVDRYSADVNVAERVSELFADKLNRMALHDKQASPDGGRSTTYHAESGDDL